MLVADVADTLSVGTRNIQQLVTQHGLVRREASHQNLADLRAAGVIPFKTSVVNLLPRETVEALVKIVNTPQAWAAYRQLWKEYRELRAPTAGSPRHWQRLGLIRA